MGEIEVGDLVVIVHATVCCGHTKGRHFGKIFKVARLQKRDGQCEVCGAKYDAINAIGDGDKYGYDTRRLRRIPPLADLEPTDTRESLPAC